MKRHVFTIIVVCLALAVLLPVLGRAEEAEGESRPEPAKEPARPAAEGIRPVAPERLSPEERAQMRERLRNMSPEERQRFITEMRGRLGPDRGTIVMPGAPEAFERQIEQLTKEQEQAVKELSAILALARKEKAAQTAKAIESLITKRRSEYQAKIQAIEQRRQRVEAMRPERRPPRPDDARRPRGKAAPDFTLPSFDGKETTLAKLKGKIVVLEWLNFECPFSKYHYETKTTMVDLAKKYKDKGVTWLAINSTNHTTAEANIAFAKQYELPYPILNDIPGKVGKAYDAKTTPHIIVIDETGVIAYDGAIDNAPMGKVAEGEKYVNYVSDALDALLAGRPVATVQTKPYGCTVKYAQ